MASTTSLSACYALALCALSWAAHADTPVRYRLTFIGISTDHQFGSSMHLSGFNNKGEVVGIQLPPGALSSEAFIWRNGEFEIIPVPFPEGGSVFPQAINDLSDVLLQAQEFEGQARHMIWHQGAFTELTFRNEPNLRITAAVDLNNRRQVLAFARDAASQERIDVIWRRHRLTRLQAPANGGNPIPFALNNRGDAGGVINRETSIPAVWRNGRLSELPLPEGALGPSIQVINDLGVAAGAFSFPDSFDNGAAVWTRTRVIRLPPLPGKDSSQIFALNNWGIVAGRSFSDFIMATDQIATIWLFARPIDLNSLLAPDDPLQPFVELRNAAFINDRGQIVVEGRDSRQANPDDVSFYLAKPEL